jgi:radical SAM protein with 4Fe4S-binding SPASM domain
MHRGVMEITTVIGCKVQCTYCPQPLLVRNYVKVARQTRMSFELFKTCIDKIPDHVEIRFWGMTEPWLNPRCTDMLLYAWQQGHPIAVFSTLAGMTKGDFDRIKHVPFTRFVVHLADAENRTRIPVTGQLLELLVYLTKFFHESGRADRYAASCHGSLHPAVEQGIREHAFEGRHLFTQMIDRAGNLDQPELPHQVRAGALVCSRAPRLNHNVLVPNGDVLLCCQDYGMEHVIGNLATGDYESLLQSPEIKKVLQLQMIENEAPMSLCRHCNYAIPADNLRAFEVARRLAERAAAYDEID